MCLQGWVGMHGNHSVHHSSQHAILGSGRSNTTESDCDALSLIDNSIATIGDDPKGNGNNIFAKFAFSKVFFGETVLCLRSKIH